MQPKFTISILVLLLLALCVNSFRRRNSYEECPKVRAMRNYQVHDMMGKWYIIQYFSSAEEVSEYACMQTNFQITNSMEITMSFTYIFKFDPDRDLLHGNIKFLIPNDHHLSHWMHKEDIYEGIYNTYVIDTDYENWALIMHCAEKIKSPRYLSALLLSKNSTLSYNVKMFLREKLPKYNIDTEFMFDISQEDCNHNITTMQEYYEYQLKNGKNINSNKVRKHL